MYWKENMSKKRIFFSAFSGDIYEVDEDEMGVLDDAQIPLTDRPKSNCRKCYGRGFTDKDHHRGTYSICTCLRKKIDWDLLKAKHTLTQPVSSSQIEISKPQEEIIVPGPVTVV
jgi:hypothetical protein